MAPMEGQYEFAQGFAHTEERRLAFNHLAGQVFGLDFEPWFQRGFWTDSYLPFTLFDGEHAVANVSANRFTLVINGQRHPAIQFGTVMTHPEYRGQGLASQLMRQAMEMLHPECDLFYLMGDKDALGFYRKFGFEAVPQMSYRLEATDDGRDDQVQAMTSGRPAWREAAAGTGRWLNVDNAGDCRILLDMAAKREPVSQRAGLLDAGHLLAFYAMNGYGDKLWLISGEERDGSDAGDLLVIFEESDGVLQMHDLLFQHPVPLFVLLPLLPHGKLAEICFGFTPDRMGIRPEDGKLRAAPLETEDEFFVMPAGTFGETTFLYPPIGLA